MRTDSYIRERIIKYWKDNVSQRNITKKIQECENVKISRVSVYKIIKKYRTFKMIRDFPRPGRKKKSQKEHRCSNKK